MCQSGEARQEFIKTSKSCLHHPTAIF